MSNWKKILGFLPFLSLISIVWIAGQGLAETATQFDPAVAAKASQPLLRSWITPEQRKDAAARAAARAAAARQTAQSMSAKGVVPAPGGTPDYFGIYPNYANSPLPQLDPATGRVIAGTGIRKFVDTLPGLGPDNANNLGQYIPVAFANVSSYPGSDYYQIGLVDYAQKMNSDLPATRLRGYKDLDPRADGSAHYLGPLIIARRDRPVRVKFTNLLPTSDDPASNLLIPVDTTVMGAGMGHDRFNTYSSVYTQNRATLHLHGGATPWISDGTPHQWITPANDPAPFKKGVSQQNVPDMDPYPGDPSDGTATFYWTNQQSGRLMFYHDHAYGITRLNVYAGEAAGYLLTDAVEDGLIDNGIIPGAGMGVYRYGIPLIIQDKTFVPPAAQLAAEDPTWDASRWGGPGDLWFPHVYMPNQKPDDPSGVNPMGRWDYGPWFWPPLTAAAGLMHGTVANPYAGQPDEPAEIPGTPNPSLVPEAFMDTPLVNGTAYPVLNVERKAYRFRILNAANDRAFNLQLYYADPAHPTEVKMVPAAPHPGSSSWPDTWPTDGRDGGVPDPRKVGPEIIQIGTEGGLLPAPVVLPNTPIGYNYNRRDIVVLNVSSKTLFLGPAERADVIIDFSKARPGSKIILYNDAPAPVPAFDTRYDYYTGDPDQTSSGGAPTTQPGYGPNTRTIMMFQVGRGKAAPAFNLAALQEQLPAAFIGSQPAPIVPEAAYGAPADTYSRIESTSLNVNNAAAPMEPKTIQELFELDYGRMNATLGTELPLTNFLTQTTIPLGYIDPPTEVLDNGEPQIWKITHNGVDTHAIHFHLFNVQLINRVGWDGAIRPPDPNELGWKETVRMNPLEDAIVALKPIAPTVPFAVPESNRLLDPTQPEGSTMGFTGVDPTTGNPMSVNNEMTNFGWEYVWHCHLLGHEENDMMRPIVFEVKPQTPGLPGAPESVSAVAGDGQATVSFNPPASDGGSAITGYTVTASSGVTTTGDASPIVVTGLTDDTLYGFTMTASNANGTGPSSALSNIVAPTSTPPAVPSKLVAVASAAAVDPPTVSLSWVNNSNNEVGCTIQRATDSLFTQGLAAFPVDARTVKFTDTTVARNVRYFYRIQAYNAVGVSAFSNTAKAHTAK